MMYFAHLFQTTWHSCEDRRRQTLEFAAAPRCLRHGPAEERVPAQLAEPSAAQQRRSLPKALAGEVQAVP